MSNYIVLVQWYVGTPAGGKIRRSTQMNLRNVHITDLDSARKAIEEQMKVDGFRMSDYDRKSYYITMLAKVDS